MPKGRREKEAARGLSDPQVETSEEHSLTAPQNHDSILSSAINTWERKRKSCLQWKSRNATASTLSG